MQWDDLTSALIKASFELPPLSRLAFCCAVSHRLLKLREQQVLRTDRCQGNLMRATAAMWELFVTDRLLVDFEGLHKRIQFCIPNPEDDSPEPGFHLDIHVFACIDECMSVGKGKVTFQRMQEIVGTYFGVILSQLREKLIPRDVKYTTIKDDGINFCHPQVSQEKAFLENVLAELSKNLTNKRSRTNFKEWTLKQCSGRLWLV